MSQYLRYLTLPDDEKSLAFNITYLLYLKSIFRQDIRKKAKHTWYLSQRCLACFTLACLTPYSIRTLQSELSLMQLIDKVENKKQKIENRK